MQVENTIKKILTETFVPTHLEVINESKNHNVPPGSETHFRVVVVSEHFAGQSMLECHRKINASLAELLKNQVHALAIVTKTPEQWQQSPDSGKSPKCLG